MATEYYVMVADTKIDEITISTTRSAQDIEPWNDFLMTLSPEEIGEISLVSEYAFDDESEFPCSGDCIGDDDSDDSDDDWDYWPETECDDEFTEIQAAVVAKYNSFMGE